MTFREVKPLILRHFLEIWDQHSQITGTPIIDNFTEFRDAIASIVNNSCNAYNNWPVKYSEEYIRDYILTDLNKTMTNTVLTMYRLIKARDEGLGDVNTFKQKDVVGYGGFDLENQNGDFSNTRTENVNNNFNNMDLISKLKNIKINPIDDMVKKIAYGVCNVIW